MKINEMYEKSKRFYIYRLGNKTVGCNYQIRRRFSIEMLMITDSLLKVKLMTTKSKHNRIIFNFLKNHYI